MARAADTGFACRCGALKGRIVGLSPRIATRVACHCDDCVRALRHYGIEADAEAGVDLVQTTPDRVKFDHGLEHLAVARLSPKGLLRWYASCCGTPIFNTLPKPDLAFSTAHTSILAGTEAIGPVTAHVNWTGPDGKSKNRNLMGAMLAAMGRAAKARLTGGWKDTPFFDMSTHAPSREPELLPREAGRG